MNTIPSASSTRVAESLAYIGGSSDAVALQEATQYYVADKIRESLKKTLVNAGSLLQNLLEFNNIKARTSEYSSSLNVSITPQALINASINVEDLKKLFLNDGPKLGANLKESQELLDELIALGFTINAPFAVPVLMTTMDEDGKILSTSFSNMSKAERDSLNSFNKIDSKSLASDVRENVVKPATKDDKGVIARYEIFDNFANLRPEKNDIELAKLYLAANASKLGSQFSNQLTTVIKAGEKLDSVIETHIKNVKEQSIRVSESQVMLQKVVIDMVQKIRLFKLDDVIRAPKNTELLSELSLGNSSDNGILTMFKNMSDRVESISSLQSNAIKSSEVNTASINTLPISENSNSDSVIKTNLDNDSDNLFSLKLNKEFNKSTPIQSHGLRGDLLVQNKLNENHSDTVIDFINKYIIN